MIPTFIICRDRVECLKNMIEWLDKIDDLLPIIMDNASTNPELNEYYNHIGDKAIVHRLTANYGNCSVMFGSEECIEGHKLPKWFEIYDCTKGYILTDCDLDLSGIPANFMYTFREGLAKYSWATKIGFQLRIDDLPNTPLANEAKGWEAMNWSEFAYLDDRRFMKAPIDTTFSFYRFIEPPNTALAHDFDKSIRCAELQARHLSWYYSKENPPPPDEVYYLNHITKDFNHYSYKLFEMLNS